MINKNLIIEKLNNHKQGNILVGFDGFIDELNYVVDKRNTPENFVKIKTISDFGNRIVAAAGLSLNVEFVSFKKKLGGNGPIMANSLIAQGFKLNYIGALGKKNIDPIFFNFSQKCENVFSLANPGHTDALEFDDGKIMLGKMSNLKDVNWKNFLTKIDLEKLKDILKKTELIAFTNWTMIPNMDTFFFGFYDILQEINSHPFIFIDLADPSKRNNNDIKDVLKQISKMQDVAKVVLGLNDSESKIVANILGIKSENFLERASKIIDNLNIEIVVIHPREGAAVSYKDKSFWVDGPFCEKPLYSTGAGDNFNGGFCTGLMSGLTPEESLITGVFTSGFYVRKGYSPTTMELIDFFSQMI